MKKILLRLCVLYTAFLLLGGLIVVFIAFTTNYGDLSEVVGCNLYDALLYGVDCRGFIGAGFLEFLAGFSLLVLQLSFFAIGSPITLVLALVFWLPVPAAIYWGLKYQILRRKERAKSLLTINNILN